MNKLTAININTRLLCPKISSLIDCLEELDQSIGIITKTWLRDGLELEQDVEDLALGARLGMLCRNLNEPAVNGVTYSGVGIVWKQSLCSFKNIQFADPDKF